MKGIIYRLRLPTQHEFRATMGRFATGVTVITVARDSEHVHGMTANSFTSVSLDPMLVLVCVGHNALCRSLLRPEQRFGVNILTEDQRAFSEYFARAEQDDEAARVL